LGQKHRKRKGSLWTALFRGACLFVLIAAGAAHMAVREVRGWASAPRSLPNPVVVELRSGMGLTSLGETLRKDGLIDDALRWRIWVRMTGSWPRFQAGTYRFAGSVSPETIADAMTSGRVWVEVVAQFTIPEGFTKRKIAERLAANQIGTIAGNLAVMRDPDVLRAHRIPGRNVEGFLYPATYSFTKMPTPAEAVGEMLKTFWQRLPSDYEARARAKGISLGDAVTFASLIELETMYADEKPLVSEVIWRRLKDNAPLGIDATIIYGIPDYDGNIRRRHLEDAKNPYNSRIHRGLPPTPIGSVTIESLEAVLAPSNMGYYYYVLLPDTDGRHHFTRTLNEHNEYVRKLVRAIQDRRRNSEDNVERKR